MARKTVKARKPRSPVATGRGRASTVAAPIEDEAIETQANVVDEEALEGTRAETSAADHGSDDSDEVAPAADFEEAAVAHAAIDRDGDEEADASHRVVPPGIDGIAPDRSAGPDGGSLVPFDPLSRYLAEIRRFPLLSREEETVISKRYAKYQEADDAYRLVTANLRLVVKIANEFARATRNLLDLIQEGNIGLMEAVKHFNPEVGIRFPSYAVWWVRAYIYRYLINNWRLVKIGTTQAQRKLFFNLRKESERLEAEGFSAQPKLLAQRMEEIRRIKSAKRPQ